MALFDGPAGSRPSRTRMVLVGLRATLTTAFLVTAYFVLPLSPRPDAATLAILVIGLVAIGVLIAWQTRAIVWARHPGLRAVETLALVIPAFLLLFAAGYYLASQARPDSFSEPLTRIDALYFTITVFATVGFGDVSPVSQGTRLVVTLQMLADLLVLGLVLQAILGAARHRSRPRHGRAVVDVAPSARDLSAPGRRGRARAGRDVLRRSTTRRPRAVPAPCRPADWSG